MSAAPHATAPPRPSAARTAPPILVSGEVNGRLDRLAQHLDQVHGPEQDPNDTLRDVLRTSRPTGSQHAWLGDREPVTHLEAYDFDTWVRWLTDTYPIRERVPRDYLSVPAVTAELWTLWRLHSRAVEDAADPRDLNDWHETLDSTMRRIDEWTREDRRARQLALEDQR